MVKKQQIIGEYIPENNWDTISISEINKLWEKIDEFYRVRGYPKMNVVWLADIIIKRLRNDRDYWINTEGIKGSGKSNLVLLLALLMCRNAGLWRNRQTGKIVKVLPRINPLNDSEWEHIEFGFKFSDNMSFLDHVDDVKNKYNKLPRYSPLVLDEGSKNLHKYGWHSKLQFTLVTLSDTERYQNKACFICLPNFKELNSVFRNDRIKMRLYIYARHSGKAYSSCIISLPDTNRFVSDPWYTDENAKVYEKQLSRIPFGARSPDVILRAEKKLKGYAGNFDVPSLKHLAPRIWNIYMKYKIDNAQKELNEIDEKEVAFEQKIYAYKNSTHKLIGYIKDKLPAVTRQEISEITGLSISQINLLRGDMEKKSKNISSSSEEDQ